ncbi:hypothetical protein FPV67DRAFT_304446 [Lyophyllum atratum]|nr:hypothetical protein FPV67DRAFT_304446 [Lyophyllum atratum]
MLQSLAFKQSGNLVETECGFRLGKNYTLLALAACTLPSDESIPKGDGMRKSWLRMGSRKSQPGLFRPRAHEHGDSTHRRILGDSTHRRSCCALIRRRWRESGIARRVKITELVAGLTSVFLDRKLYRRLLACRGPVAQNLLNSLGQLPYLIYQK